MWVLGYAWVALLAGLGLLGMAGYSIYSADHGGKIPQEAELTAASGHIVEGREVTVERKRRRGGKTTKKYYELDLKKDDGTVVKLRVDFAVPRDKVADAVDEDVSVKYDAHDENDTYVITLDGQDLVSYADMARLSQARADADKETFTSGGMIGFAIVLALLGAVGVRQRRKMIARETAQAAAAVPSVTIGENVKSPGQQ
jgi:hypothetical protein